jgi:hypothetical protein
MILSELAANGVDRQKIMQELIAENKAAMSAREAD